MKNNIIKSLENTTQELKQKLLIYNTLSKINSIWEEHYNDITDMQLSVIRDLEECNLLLNNCIDTDDTTLFINNNKEKLLKYISTIQFGLDN